MAKLFLTYPPQSARESPLATTLTFISQREREPKTTNFDEEELEILAAWKAGKLRQVQDVPEQLESHCSSTEANLKITLDPSKCGGSPCIRGLRITAYDVLSMLSKGMLCNQVLEHFPELTMEDIYVVFAYAADREHRV